MAKFKRGDVVRLIDNEANRKECRPETMIMQFLVLIPEMKAENYEGEVFLALEDMVVEYTFPPEALENVPPVLSRWPDTEKKRQSLARKLLKACVQGCKEHHVVPPS